jgi:RES domain
MSSSISIADALSSSVRQTEGRCWRFVEAQHHVSTTKLTDTLAEQRRLEVLIDGTKPAIPPECRDLHFLLATPFRYGAPYPNGSRFRRAGLTLGVFYGAQREETAAAEIAYYRLLFFAESPQTPWPANPGQYTSFCAEYGVSRCVDLTQPPLSDHRALWTNPVDRAACQALADEAHKLGIEVIKYHSVRDPERGLNIALLSCRAFTNREPIALRTWRIHLSPRGARAMREFPASALNFDRAAFASDPRIADMNWDRPAHH